MKAELVPENGDPPIPITRDLTVVGRRSCCDVVIDHHGLSKRHCVLVKTEGLLVVRDLISTNGTKVKGQKIRWAALLPDDRLTLGSYKVRVYLGSDEAPSPSERAGRKASPASPPPSASPGLAAQPSAKASPPFLIAPPASPKPGWGQEEEGDDSGWRNLLEDDSDEELIILE